MPGRTTNIPAVLWKALLVQSHGKGMAGSKSGRFAHPRRFLRRTSAFWKLRAFRLHVREAEDCWPHADHGPPARQFRSNALPEAAADKGGRANSLIVEIVS